MHESKFRDFRQNIDFAISDFENDLNHKIKSAKDKAFSAKKEKRKLSNPKSIKKANEKRLKNKKMKQFTQRMRKID